MTFFAGHNGPTFLAEITLRGGGVLPSYHSFKKKLEKKNKAGCYEMKTACITNFCRVLCHYYKNKTKKAFSIFFSG